MVLRHAEHLHHVLARLGHHDAERGKQYREVGARPVYLQVLQRRSCFPIAPRGVQTTSCTSSPRLTMWSPCAKSAHCVSIIIIIIIICSIPVNCDFERNPRPLFMVSFIHFICNRLAFPSEGKSITYKMNERYHEKRSWISLKIAVQQKD